MSERICLRCGNGCASYATQCPACQAFLQENFVADPAANKHIIQILSLLRQGLSLSAIADKMTSDGERNLQLDAPWTQQSVAFVVHHFTDDAPGTEKDEGICYCQQCNTILVEQGQVCKNCQVKAEHEQHTSAVKKKLKITLHSLMIIFLLSYFPIFNGFMNTLDEPMVGFILWPMAILLYLFILGVYIFGGALLSVISWIDRQP